MRKYIVKNDKNFIREYDVKDDVIEVSYGDSLENQKIKTLPYSEENVEFLDELMISQYNEYSYNGSINFSANNLLSSSILGTAIGLFVFMDELNNEAGINSSIAISIPTAIVLFITAQMAFGTSDSKEAIKDYEKDKLLIENFELLDKIIKTEQSFNQIPRGIRKKVADIHDGNANLGINSVKKLNLKEMEKLVYQSKEYVRKR